MSTTKKFNAASFLKDWAAVIVMILPLEASIEILCGNFSPTLSGLPVICVSPDGLFAAIIRRGDKSPDIYK